MSKIELPPHVSYSQISTYSKCGEQYRLERVVKAPSRPGWALPGGSAVHSATQVWDESLLGGTLLDNYKELFEEAFDREIADSVERSGFPKEEFRASGRKSKEWPDKETEDWWRQHGPTFVASWAAWRLNSPWEIATMPDGSPAIEANVNPTLGGVPVKCYIDRVMVTGDGELVICDLKTGREPDSTLQLGTYRAALATVGVDVTYGSYWMARTGMNTPAVDLTKYTPAYLDHWYGTARRGMEAGIFTPNVSSMCNSCAVKDSCFAYGGVDAAKFAPFNMDGV